VKVANYVAFMRAVNVAGHARVRMSDVRDAFEQVPGKTGAIFRLPSETEWEYAARSGRHWVDPLHGVQTI